MCGIVGYVGWRDAADVVLEGLARLEYRGYDSAGIAVQVGAGPVGALATAKTAGRLLQLEKVLAEAPLPAATVGIGHTRWATHGSPTDHNAHPHLSGDGSVAVVHNGIIENYAALRAESAAAGVRFASETDTEVVAHLLADAYLTAATGPGRFAAAMRAVVARLSGAFTLVAAHADEPTTLVGARRNSPLVVGIGDGEYFLGSDVTAFIAHTRAARELGQDQVVEIDAGRGVTVTDFTGRPVTPPAYTVDWDASAAAKDGHEWFMLKEIAEQPRAVADTLLGRLDPAGRPQPEALPLPAALLRGLWQVVIVACGTAYHAGLITRYALEAWTGLPVSVELASEFRYRDQVLGPGSLVVAISQSGETMDTLMAVRHAQAQGAPVLAVCNVAGSTIAREADAVLYTRAGPEVAVASTKAFLTQLTAGYLAGLALAGARATLPATELAATGAALHRLPGTVGETLGRMGPVRELARGLATANKVLFLGRHVGYPVALEGALKLKELAYIHAEGFAAGELKHGPIAVVDAGTPIVVVMPGPHTPVHDKMLSNIQEVRARGARTVVIAEDGDEAVSAYADALIRVPATPPLLVPVVATVPLQVLACEIAAARGLDVDQPRNLAKSVTVE